MQEDVIHEEVYDSDIELGPVAVRHLRAEGNTAPAGREAPREVRQALKAQTFSFRKLRTKTFTQRHVYTVDLCKFLNLETEGEIEKLAIGKTDEQVMSHLNKLYLKRKQRYDDRGIKRHKFTKQNFEIYVEDFKKYEASGAGKSFYDSIQEEVYISSPVRESSGSSFLGSSPLKKHQEELSKAPKRPNSTRERAPTPVTNDYEFPDSQEPKDEEQQSENHAHSYTPHGSSPPTASGSNLPTEELESTMAAHAAIPVILPSSPASSPGQSAMVIDPGAHGSTGDAPDDAIHDYNVQELAVTEQQGSNAAQSTEITVTNESQVHLHSVGHIGRSLRARKFSQNHVYTVDLCAYLGLATKSELDSFAESGKPDSEIFSKLESLYEARRKKNPRMERGKFKFASFAHHLEDHTKKYQRQVESLNVQSQAFNLSQQDDFVSSQISAEDAYEAEELDSDVDDTESVTRESRKRLKGVLPFSYLKLGDSLGKTHSAYKRSNMRGEENRLGIAKRRVKKVHHNDDHEDFINDEINAPYDDPYNIDAGLTNIEEEPEERPEEEPEEEPLVAHEAYEVSDGPESAEENSAMDSDVEIYGSSPSLFGMAEEDNASGIDRMLNRTARGKRNGSEKRKVAAPKRRSGASNVGVGTWSTGSNRIYKRNKHQRRTSQRDHQRVQPKLDLPVLEVFSDEGPEGDNHTPADILKSNRATNKRSPMEKLGFSLKNSSRPSSVNKDAGLKNTDGTKKKHQNRLYGISPNLEIHALSRTPQSFAPQLEGESHKYRLIKQKRFSKENLNPLEPPKIFEIPDYSPEQEIDPWNDDHSIAQANKVTSISGSYRELKNYHSIKGSLLSHLDKEETTESGIITWSLDGVNHVLSISGMTPVKAHRTIQKCFAELISQAEKGDRTFGFSHEIEAFFIAMLKWVNISQANSTYSSDLVDNIQEFRNQISEIIIKKVIPLKSKLGRPYLLFISWSMLLLFKCSSTNKSGEVLNKIGYNARSFVQIYLLYAFVCEDAHSLINQMQDINYFESWDFICNITTYFSELSFWSELSTVFQRGFQLQAEMSKMLDLFRLFTCSVCNIQDGACWKTIVVMLRACKKLEGFDLAKTIRGIISAIFEVHRTYSLNLDEAVVTALYEVISHCKFRNFPDERDSLTFKIGDYQDIINYNPKDSILDCYFKLLEIYLGETSRSKGLALVEKIIPISSLKGDSTMSSVVFVNRTNVLLVYTNLFRSSFLKQLILLFRGWEIDNEMRLELKFRALSKLLQIHLRHGLRQPMDDIKRMITKMVERFNSILTTRLNISAIQESSNYLQRVFVEISSFFDLKGIDVGELFGIVNELLDLKFHATSLLRKLLLDVIFLVRRSLTKMIAGLDSGTKIFIKTDYYESLTTLLGAQLSIYTPMQSDNLSAINLLVAAWCDVSQYLVSQGLIEWNSVLFYHWSNIAGSKQREPFELVLLEKILDNNQERQSIPKDIFLRALSRHLVKFSNNAVYSFLKKLIKYYENEMIMFSNSFGVLDSRNQFDKTRVQVVISYVYFLKKLSQEMSSSGNEARLAENLLVEMVISLDREYEVQARLMTNMVWFSHFATKVAKFVNYSCFELVRNSIEFSQLRNKLKLSYHSDVDYAEKFKLKMTSVRSLEEAIKIMETELISSIIHGEEADSKFCQIFQSLIVEQMCNSYQASSSMAAPYSVTPLTLPDNLTAEAEISPLFPLTAAIASHVQILSNRNNSLLNWYMILKYLRVMVASILQKGSMGRNDIYCSIRMIQNITTVSGVDITTVHAGNFKNLIMIQLYELMMIVYNLTTGHVDQDKFLTLIKSFMDSSNVSSSDVNQNQDFMNCIRVINEEIPISDELHDIITNISKAQAARFDDNFAILKRTVDHFTKMITSDENDDDTPLFCIEL